MLQHLSIRNFAIVKQLDIDFSAGLSAITGETGAGKSIAIDALGLCLGERADAQSVRSGCDKTEICATFSLCDTPKAKTWLAQQDMHDEGECLIRRIISKEGRSKAYINGSPATLAQLKALGQLLVSIHGQQAHQQILRPEVQRKLLDNAGGHQVELERVQAAFTALNRTAAQLDELAANQQQRQDRKRLLEYQVQELDEFSIGEFEFEALEAEFKRLSHGQSLLEQSQLSFHQLYDNEQLNALGVIQDSLERLTALQEHDEGLKPIVVMLNDAAISVDEAAQELRHYMERLEIDPLKMQQTEARYASCMELARKHQVQPEALYERHMQLCQELNELRGEDCALDELREAICGLQSQYQDAARRLSKARCKAAKAFGARVEEQIRRMNMADAQFSVEVNFGPERAPAKHGLDEIRFTIAANKGQAAEALDKVVSGGELSRIGLAIQVLSSSAQTIPTLIFDEVDSGISGPTASVVGQLLRQLGEQVQVMCVTHLPQVAARAHQQMFVTKFTDKDSTQTAMLPLSQEERVQELARLLAGDQMTESAMANARELLGNC